MLDREPVLQADMVLIGVERKLRQGQHQNEQRHHYDGLEGSEARSALRPLTQARTEVRPQHEAEHQQAPTRSDEVKRAVQQVKSIGLLQLVRRKGVLQERVRVR